MKSGETNKKYNNPEGVEQRGLFTPLLACCISDVQSVPTEKKRRECFLSPEFILLAGYTQSSASSQ
jgi:hypothetical protein